MSIFSSSLKCFVEFILIIEGPNIILSFINIRKVPSEVLKTEGKARGFQHFLGDLANFNEWKIMFDPSIIKITVQGKQNKSWFILTRSKEKDSKDTCCDT